MMSRCVSLSFFAFVLMLPTSGSVAAGIIRNVSVEEAYSLVQARGENIFLLDVRTPSEYRDVRLAGARLIPIDQLVKRVSEIPKNRPILVYCAVGSRSSQVVGYLARAGFPEVYNLYGGIYAWGKQGYPVLTGPP